MYDSLISNSCDYWFIRAVHWIFCMDYFASNSFSYRKQTGLLTMKQLLLRMQLLNETLFWWRAWGPYYHCWKARNAPRRR